MSEIHCEVTFHLPEVFELDALKAKARQCDDEAGTDAPEDYTIAQALQVVWHHAPQWLHTNALAGWTMDKASDEQGTMRPVWPAF